MKLAFAICALLFVAMYAYAQVSLENPPNDGVIHLRWATDQNPARDVQTALFNKLNPGYTVAVDPSAQGDASKVIVQCATGVGPDIIDLGQSDMETDVNTGVLLDLTPYAKQMGFDPSKTYASIAPSLEVDGHQYRFPCNVCANAIIYNKKIFDDHNVPYPTSNWTFADFVRTCKEIINNKSKTEQKNLAIANYSDTWFVGDLIVCLGGQQFSADGTRCILDSPADIAAMQDYYNLIWVDHAIPSPAESSAMSSQGGWGSGGLNWFSEGKAAMISIGRWYIVQAPQYPNLKGNLGCVLFPRIGNKPSSTLGVTRAAGINAKSPHWKAALKFLQYLASPQYSQVIVQDGDSLPPSPKLATTGAALVNDMVPDPAFHQPFIDAMTTARSLNYSPFIDAAETDRWMAEYIQDVENRVLMPAQAMRKLTAQINRQIAQNIERRPDLQKLYEQRTGKPFQGG